MNLYQLTGKIAELETQFIENHGEVSDEELSEYLELTDALLPDKAAGYIAVIKNAEAAAEAYKAEAKRLSDLARLKSKLVDRLKDRIRDAMIFLDVPKIETRLGRLQVNTSGAQAVEIDVPVDELPEKFKRTVITVSPDLKLIGASLKDNDPEAEEIAHLAEKKRYLKIY